jgi:hypothetical protein
MSKERRYIELMEGEIMQNDDMRNMPYKLSGMVVPPPWINEEDEKVPPTKPVPPKPETPVQKPIPGTEPIFEKYTQRPDGKELCKYLRSIRKELASANGIELKTVECDYKGPCAGTCPTCDAEIRFLNDKLSEIKEEERVYPTISMYEVKPEKKKRGFFGKKKD